MSKILPLTNPNVVHHKNGAGRAGDPYILDWIETHHDPSVKPAYMRVAQKSSLWERLKRVFLRAHQ